MSKKKIYLDYAATTPLTPEVERAMRPYGQKVFGNPGSTHWFGQQASAAVFQARQTMAGALDCDYKEIVFTGSATEANNLALRGVANPGSRIIVSAIEHESVLETARDLEKQGVEVVYLPVNKEGVVDLKKLKAALDERTILVSIQHANSEIGTIQPIKEIVSIVKGQKSNVLVHCDAVQAFQFLPCRVDELGVDMMTLSAHKIYGPKGIGALYIRSLNPKPYPSNITSTRPEAQNYINRSNVTGFTGGGQEFGFRSGTENVAAIVGFAKATELISNGRQENKRIAGLRNYLWREIKKIVPEAELNGPAIFQVKPGKLGKPGNRPQRLANNLNIYFPGRPAPDLALELDLWGVAVSPGTACSARSAKASPVIEALGYEGDRPKSSLRFTLGRPTTKAEIDQALEIFRKRFTITK